MTRYIILSLAMILPTMAGAEAFDEPSDGIWFNPDQSGNGLALDTQNGILVVTAFVYLEDGTAVWYQGAARLGPAQADLSRTWSAKMNRFTGGQVPGGPYTQPQVDGDLGTMEIVFTGLTEATVSWNGETERMIRQNFGYEENSAQMLGIWQFDIKFSDEIRGFQYEFSRVGDSLSGGSTDAVYDDSSFAVAECVSDEDVDDSCSIVDFDANGNIELLLTYRRSHSVASGTASTEIDGTIFPAVGYQLSGADKVEIERNRSHSLGRESAFKR